jgi:4-hydroxyphenylpyruvate dioxygenase
MRPCLNQVTAGRAAPNDLAAQLTAIRSGGWEALELWLPHWDPLLETHSLGAARRLLDEAGLQAVGACAQTGLLFAPGARLHEFRDQLARRLEQCAALGAGHLVVTPGPAQLPERPSVAALETAADNLRAAAERAAAHGVRLGIEFLKGARLVNNLPTALWLADRVDHPAIGVVLDTFHLYAGPSKLEDLALLQHSPERLFFVHVNDVPAGKPRELWTDADRVLPGDGAVPVGAILAAIRDAGYAGYASLELFNEAFASRWASDPVGASSHAYRATRHILGGRQ